MKYFVYKTLRLLQPARQFVFLFLIFLSLLFLLLPQSIHAENTKPCTGCNIILISIDTLRQDVLGLYGGKEDVSPHLDNFAKSATVYDEYYSVSPYTAPAHATMFTGLSPLVHHVCNLTEYSEGRCESLPRSIKTLASLLKQHGYQTSAIHNNGNISSQNGLER